MEEVFYSCIFHVTCSYLMKKHALPEYVDHCCKQITSRNFAVYENEHDDYELRLFVVFHLSRVYTSEEERL
jgi:hypothetical protein